MDIQEIRKVVDNGIFHKVDYAKIPLDDLRQLLELAETQAISKADDTHHCQMCRCSWKIQVWNYIQDCTFCKERNESPKGDKDTSAEDNTHVEKLRTQFNESIENSLKEVKEKARRDTIDECIQAIEIGKQAWNDKWWHIIIDACIKVLYILKSKE